MSIRNRAIKAFRIVILAAVLLVSAPMLPESHIVKADSTHPAMWKFLYNPPVVGLFSGSATYNYPLEVPPGRGGMQPSVNFSYNSSRVNGLLGYLSIDAGPLGLGWSMDQMDITRRASAWKICASGEPCYKDKFVLAMNGTSYELEPADDVQVGRFYAEGAPGLYVERHNDKAGNGTPIGVNVTGEYWIVRTPDGTTYRLGYKSNSEQVMRDVRSNGGYVGREGEETTVKRWRVDLAKDVHGNLMAFTYQEFVDGDGSDKWSLLKEIKYNKADSGDYLSWVKFGISCTSSGLGPCYDAIEVYDGVSGSPDSSELVRRYQLTTGVKDWWECGITLHQRYLAKIQVHEPGGQTLPATTFGYTYKDNWKGGCYPYPRISWIENGYGGRAEFDYTGDDERYAHTQCPIDPCWNNCCALGNCPQDCPNLDPDAVGQSYRVTAMRTYDGINDPQHAKTTYEYENFCYGNDGSVCEIDGARGHEPIVGYGKVTQWVYDYDGSLAAMSTHRFNVANKELVGREYRTQQKDTDGTVLVQTDTSFSIHPFGPTHFATTDEVVSTDYTGGEPISTRVTYEYDAYGNVTGVNQMDENDELYRRTVTAYVHNHDPWVWIVNKPALQEVYDGEGTLLAATLYAYDGGLSPADGIGEKGELTLVRQRTLEGNETVDTAYAYDTYGNVVTETVYTTPGSVSAAVPSPDVDWIVPTAPLVWERDAGNPVMENGSYSWDAKRVSGASVLYENGVYKMWYSAWDDAGMWRIGYATSPDGETWTKRSTAVLGPQAGTFRSAGVRGPTVVKDGDTYVMWFGGSNGSTWSIGYATSSDGITWSNVQQVLTPGSVAWVGSGGEVSLPTVVLENGEYHMWFQGGAFGSLRIGYASSSNGVNWTAHPTPVLENGAAGRWDETEARSPDVVWDGERYHMWYTGKGSPGGSALLQIGYAYSLDGVNWTKMGWDPVLAGKADGSWEHHVMQPAVLLVEGELRMWYSGMYAGYADIGLATTPLVSGWRQYEGSPVLENGDYAWEAARANGATVLYDEAEGLYKMWYSGSDTISGDTWSIGYATSPDGVAWTKRSTAVLEPVAGTFRDDGVQGPTVVKEGAGYVMWFGGRNGTWTIGRAESTDGVTWTNVQQVLTAGDVAWVGTGEEVSNPMVVVEDGEYHMWFQGGAFGSFRIGYASSSNGVTWTAHSTPVLENGPAGSWDETEVRSPEVVWDGETFHMWYTGKGNLGASNALHIGYASSTNGTDWEKDTGNPVLRGKTDGGWEHNAMQPAVLQAEYEFKMWYSGMYAGYARIGLATLEAIPWVGGPAGGSSPDSRDSTIEYDGTYHMYPVETCTPEVDGVGRLCTEIAYYGVEGVSADDGLPGQVKSITDPNGATTSYKYDDFGRLLEVYKPLQQGSGVPSITYKYGDGQFPFMIRVWQLTVTDPDPSCYGNASCYYANRTYYDGLGREIEQKYYVEGDLTAMVAVEYNALGQVARQSLPYEATTSAWIYETPDWTKPHTTYEYDILSRAVRADNPDGTYVHTIYDGLVTTAVDAEGHQKRYTNDVWGQLLKVEEFSGERRLFWEVEAGASWSRYAGNPVMSYGSYSWDSKRVTQPSVLYDGETYRMWYGALDDGNVWRIGYATSPDGKAWTKRSTAVLQPQAGTFYADGINNPSVVDTGDGYVMWFSGDSGGVTTIGRAESEDGITWTDVQQVLTAADVDWVSAGEMVANPSVVLRNDGYHMWFQGGTWDDAQIGYAYSMDGVDWEVRSTPVLVQGSAGSWDDTAVWSPSVVWDGGQYHMWYVGKADAGWGPVSHVGYATSPDGVTWTKDTGNPVLAGLGDGSWEHKVTEPAVVQVGEKFKMWYAGANGGYQKIGLATIAVDLQEESSVALYATTEYEYDTRGQLVKVTDEKDNVTTMEYDTLGRKVAMHDPDMGDWTYDYSLLGNLTSQTDAKGCTISFEYDELNRPTQKSYAGCAGSPGAVTYTYDQGTNGLGRLSRMDDPSGWAEYDYDAQGRAIVQRKHINGADTFETAWAYDPMDRVTSMTYPDGEVVPYTYETGRLETVGAYVTAIDNNATGQIETLTLGNGVVTQYAYNGLNLRLQNVQASKDTTTLLDLSYTYDDMGNVLSIADGTNGGQVQHFDYDHLDRLTHAWTTGGGNGAYDRTYAYDEIGNLTTKSDVGAYTYPASGVGSVRPHAVSGTANGWSFQYDDNGNMTDRYITGDGDYDLTYTAENKVAQVRKDGSIVATYTYDGNGVRVKRVTDEGTTYYVGGYYEEFHPAESADAGGSTDGSPDLHAALSAALGGEPEPGEPPTVVPADPGLLLMAPALGMLLVLGRRKKRHTNGRRTLAWTVGNVVLAVAIVSILAWFTVKPVLAAGPEVTKYYYAGAQRVAMRKGSAVYYLHGDHLGSTSLATDANGNEVPDSRVLYYPYGEVRYGDLEDLPTDFGFTGQRVEESLGGLLDYNARYYDPALGRFVSADTIIPGIDSQAWNRYIYVNGNPLRYTDPTGHLTEDQIKQYTDYNDDDDIESLKEENPELYWMLRALHLGDWVVCGLGEAVIYTAELVEGQLRFVPCDGSGNNQEIQDLLGYENFSLYRYMPDDSSSTGYSLKEVYLWSKGQDPEECYWSGQPGELYYHQVTEWQELFTYELGTTLLSGVVGALAVFLLSGGNPLGGVAGFVLGVALDMIFGAGEILLGGPPAGWAAGDEIYLYFYDTGTEILVERYIIRDGEVLAQGWSSHPYSE